MLNKMKISEVIKKRRSIRRFSCKKIEDSKIMKVLEAGRWAPSGYNNQPWRFLVIKNKRILGQIAELTNKWDEKTINNSSICILVYLDKNSANNAEQDNLSIGACIQNILLEACCQKLGACWVCGVLKNKDKINKMLKMPKNLELKSLISVGYPAENPKVPRKNLKSLIIKEIK